MKKFFLLFIFVIPFCIFAADTAEDENTRREKKLLQSMAQYPDIVASFGSHKFSKKDAVKWVLESHPDFEDYSYPELTDAIEQTIDDKIFYTLIADFLTGEGFPPSANSTMKYLQQSIKNFPPELSKLKFRNNAIQTLAAEPDRQLSVALQSYLKKKHPEIISVSDDEVEYFYRVNQNIFMHDAKIDIGFIAVDKKADNAEKSINHAHSMLMQGVPFEKLAGEINAKLPENFFGIRQFPPEIAAYAAQMEVNTPSDVLEFPNYFAIICIKEKQEPQYIKPEKAAFFIRTELESRKSGIFLEELLSELLEKYPVSR